MEQNKTFPYWTIAIVLIILAGGYFYFSGKNTAPVAQNESGKVYVTVSDASAHIQNVSEVALTVDKVELHSATQGWVTVSSVPRSFNLLTLKANGRAELAGDAAVAVDTYDQVRATIGAVEVKTTNAGTKVAVLASHTLAIAGTVMVKANESSQVNLDVRTSDSLHVTAKGEYVFAPVVALESRHSASVSVESDNSVMVSGGTVDASTIVGTDLSGEVQVGSELSPSVQIQIVGGAPVMVTGTATSSSSGLIKVDITNTLNSGVGGSAGGSVNIGY